MEEAVLEQKTLLAEHYFLIGKYDKAYETYKSYLSDSPNDGSIFLNIAICALNLERYEEAKDFCFRSLENDGENSEIFYILALIESELDNFYSCEDYLLKVLQLDPENARAIAAYSYLMVRTGHTKKATELMNEALRIDSNDSKVLHYYFLFQMAKGDKTNIVDSLGNYLESASNEVSKWIHLGFFHWDQKNFKEANEAYRQAFLLDPKSTELLNVIEITNKLRSPVFKPIHLIHKVGPIKIWMVFLIVSTVLSYSKQDLILVIFVGVYLFLVLYSWVVPPLYNLFYKIKRR